MVSIARSLISGSRLARGYLSSRSHTTGGWDGARSRLLSGAVRGVSLDCFDTLLARHEADWEQVAVAELVARSQDIPVMHIRDVLGAAARKAREEHGGPDNEPAALTIWSAFCGVLGLPPRLATLLTDAEHSLLEMSISANPKALDLIALIEEQDISWIVCSDSRWHGSHLARLLATKGFIVPESRVFTSCEHGRSKFRGNLYGLAHNYWKTTLGPATTPGDILHIGDNLLADCCSAACFGWQSIRVPPARSLGDTPVTELASEPLHRLYQEISAVLA